MKKLILTLSLLVSSLAFGQEDVPFEILGVWQNTDGEAVQITRNGEEVIFQRRNSTSILAVGTITLVDGELHINRYDKEDEYRLSFFIGKETMVISKPRSTQAWLWNKIQ